MDQDEVPSCQPAYQLIRTRKRKRTISLSIARNGDIIIRAPFHLKSESIEAFFREKRSWIQKKLRETSAGVDRSVARGFVAGEVFPFLGQYYPLEIVAPTDSHRPLLFAQERFYLNERYRTKARDLFISWYKEQAREKIRERVQLYGSRMLLFPDRQKITSARYQWGGCSSKNTLTFTWRIVMAPLPVIDYLVVHELAHIREKNHSSRFWKIVRETFPDYPTMKAWLKSRGHLLDL